MSSWAASFDEFGDVDTKVATWSGDGGAQGFEKCSKAARGYFAGMNTDEIQLAGPRLWQNLRGEARGLPGCHFRLTRPRRSGSWR